MRRAFQVCALCLALSIFSGANCGKRGSAETVNSGAANEKRGETADASNENSSDPFARIPRMTLGELRKALGEGRAVLADVRPSEAFEDEHIEGAFSVPEDDWAAHVEDLPKDKLVVTYCA